MGNRLLAMIAVLVSSEGAGHSPDSSLLIQEAVSRGAEVVFFSVPSEISRAATTGPVLAPEVIRRILAAHKERTLAETDLRVVFDFEYLGVALVEKPSVDSRSRALENPNIALVSPPPVFETLLSATDSANQLNAGALEALGISGQGASVLVTDSGLASGFNNHSDFGFCTAPGVPSSCQMASYHVLDATGDNPHGTNVAGIVARTARSAKIHFYDVGCTGICINGAMAMLALNEATQNAATLNIVVHNMSWGSAPPANCSAYDGWFAPAVAVGMIQVAASGNDFSS